MKSFSLKKLLNGRILIILLFLFTIILGASRVKHKREEPIFLFDHTMMTISTASMEPEYLVNSIIIIKKAAIKELSIGDVIVYKSNINKQLVFHRITRFVDNGFYVKGDKNKFEDNVLITEQTYIGKCIFHSNSIAKYLNSIKSIPGFIFFFLLPCNVIICLYYILKIYIKRFKKYETI